MQAEAVEAVVGGGYQTSLLTHSLLFLTTPVTGRAGSIPAGPQSALGCLLTPAEWPNSHPLPPHACPETPGLVPLGAPHHLAVPPFRKHLLRAHCELELPHQQLSPATHPFPARPACRLRDSRREAQAPRERPQRSRCMAGSDTGLPGGSRGNGGWRPLKRDQCPPAELAEPGRGGGNPWAGLCPGL